MPENTNPEDDLFEAALLRPPGPERGAFLDGECRSDPELRARVEMMLEGHLNAKDFLETAPGRVAPEREIASPESAGLEQVGSHIGPYKLLQTGRRRLRARLFGRTEPTGASSRRVEDHQVGHGHPKCDCSI